MYPPVRVERAFLASNAAIYTRPMKHDLAPDSRVSIDALGSMKACSEVWPTTLLNKWVVAPYPKTTVMKC